ncbi:equilibrative nucleoside transporter 1-like isoform X2 [Lethenteron reissneri]|uniref:equilibrative nucleoside transporter 1-like isoform X2 n=1 Tax=Lethenteron reissneri TaxID=7753 RepID=UPI002AB71B49|nr:equilibrative nucleoside transporter 1-like isoform X2 [Lethenteron reissneri]
MPSQAAPQDRYHLVWIIFFILGLGSLLPWNFFMTATMYFKGRLQDKKENVTARNSNGSNDSISGAPALESELSKNFDSTMTICSMVPLLIFCCLNSMLHTLIPIKLRIVGGLGGILMMFVLTGILVWASSLSPSAFFGITMVTVFLINCGADSRSAAFWYFVTACVVTAIAIFSYLCLPRLKFARYYLDKDNHPTTTDDTENKNEHIANGDSKVAGPHQAFLNLNNKGEEPPKPDSIYIIFRKIWPMALCVCCVFWFTIAVFPALTVRVATFSTHNMWNSLFLPVCCFLTFGVSDFMGRSLTAVVMWPGEHSCWFPVLVAARLVFIPAFLLCNVTPHPFGSALLAHDVAFFLVMLLFGMSSGYLASLAMSYGPKQVEAHNAETAGSVMMFFLALGLALGAATSFIMIQCL